MGDGPGIKGLGPLSGNFFSHEKFRRPFPVQTSEILNTISTHDTILMFDGEPMTPATPELVLTLALAMRTSL
jgi:hypothetical protein